MEYQLNLYFLCSAQRLCGVTLWTNFKLVWATHEELSVWSLQAWGAMLPAKPGEYSRFGARTFPPHLHCFARVSVLLVRPARTTEDPISGFGRSSEMDFSMQTGVNHVRKTREPMLLHLLQVLFRRTSDFAIHRIHSTSLLDIQTPALR